MNNITSPLRNEIDDELRDILGNDAGDMLASRRKLQHQLDTQAFSQQRATRRQQQPWFTQSYRWLVGSGAALAAVILIVIGIEGMSKQEPVQVRDNPITLEQRGHMTTQETDEEASEVDVLVMETRASADDVWERGEVDISRLLTGHSGK